MSGDTACSKVGRSRAVGQGGELHADSSSEVAATTVGGDSELISGIVVQTGEGDAGAGDAGLIHHIVGDVKHSVGLTIGIARVACP